MIHSAKVEPREGGRYRPLSRGTVDVWAVGLSASAPLQAEMLEVLSRDERERAARFRFDRHRDAFIVAHGVLRHLLAAYLGGTPGSLSFAAGPAGKPFLRDASAAVQFNLAHTEDLVLYAFTLDVPVGVDVETRRAYPDALELAGRFFAPLERSAVEEATEADRPTLFLRVWTRKEAILKASGEGLSIPLDAFDVLPLETTPVPVSLSGKGTSDQRPWWIHDLVPDPDHVGAVAVPESGSALQSWRAATADGLLSSLE